LKSNGNESSTASKWSTAGGQKCSCGSGKKFKKCCKKLAKHYQAGGGENETTTTTAAADSFGDTLVDELNTLIEKLEIEIINYKKKGAKQEKIKMMKELTKLKQQRDELANKLKRERHLMFKAQKQQSNGYDRDHHGNNGSANKKQTKKKQNKSQSTSSPPPQNNGAVSASVNHVIAI